MPYLGIIKLGSNLTFYANTHTPSTGAAVDADAVPGYRIYEDETAGPLLTGSMALLDDANTVGFYSEQIAVSAANGFEAGKSYCVRITGVVGAVTGVEIHQFDVSAKLVDTLNDLAVGALMGLANDAITKDKFDESTAWPLLAADAAATQVFRVGADADTAETLSDQIDGAGISLTAQQSRDANKLAPTAGAPAAGSVDEHLDNIPTAQTRWTH